MSDVQRQIDSPPPRFHPLRRKDVLAGLLFIAVAAIGLWASRNYAIGTTTRMGTGYVPRLLCWILLALGALVLVQGRRGAGGELTAGPPVRRALIFAPLSLLVFALLIGPFGVVAATVALVIVGALASPESRPLEVVAAAIFLVLLTLVIFVWGVGLPIPVWPEW
jgi:putative tricarboxylic transport membrane protein